MAYRLKRSEPVGKSLKQVARRELKNAAQQLQGDAARGHEEPIHEARKSIKKVRALLRLIQDGLGVTYRKDSARLRQAGQALSPVRDAAALITAFDRLVKRKKIGKRDVAAVRCGLVERKTRVEEQLSLAELIAGTARKLEQARRSGKRWKVERGGFRVIQDGLKKTFRRGRKVMCTALKSVSREDLHEWRKRVKDHWYQVRLLAAETAYERRFKDLEDALGEYLNLGLLRRHGHGAPPELLEALAEEETELRQNALEIGRKVYREKPRAMARMLRKAWKQPRAARAGKR
jgi:CHAD domain-containing protein